MSIERKKKLGAFYTPDMVTDILCDWAIRHKDDRLLEPSFGGCNFLISSIKKLEKLNCHTPLKFIYGYDIDSNAFKILKRKGLAGKNFLLKDFLKSTAKDIPRKVNVVLGNPPYLPIHKLEKAYRNEVLTSILQNEIKIDKKSSLWVYFITHSLQFLVEGGRMAWIVPDSIYFTDYGSKFLGQISCLFSSTRLLRIKERFFYESGTYEKTSILLCDGFGGHGIEPEIYNFDLLETALENIKSNQYNRPIEVEEKVNLISNSFKLIKLSDIFDIRIGIVLGATKFLTFKSEDIAKSQYFPKYLYPLITKGKQLEGLSINKSKLLKISNLPAYVIDGINMEACDFELYQLFLESIPNEILDNATFKKRVHPFGYDDFNHPDAFLTYFAQKLPRLIENTNNELNCTNSLHRLYLKKEYINRSDVVRLVALQMFCNFTKEKTLMLAREYGNQILKFEPSDAQKIPVFVPKLYDFTLKTVIYKCFTKVESLLEMRKSEDAQKVAMEFLNSIIYV